MGQNVIFSSYSAILAQVVALPSDSYFSFFTSRPLPQVGNLFLLVLARLTALIALTPFLGAKVMPDPMKLGLAVALTPLFLPPQLVGSLPSFQLDVTFMLMLVKEAFIGGLLGLLLSIPFFAAQGAGTLIDHQSGSQSLQVTDPSSQTQASPTGLLYNNVMLAIFFLTGGPFLFFDAVATSFQVFPASSFVPPALMSEHSPLLHSILKVLTSMLVITLQLCAPSLIALLMSDLFLGIANRMAPQVQISFLLWSLKSYAGIALLWAGWWFILKQIDVQSVDWIKMVNYLLNQTKIFLTNG